MAVTERAYFESISGGSGLSEAVAGVVAIILAILGLAHVAPVFLVAIAAIAVGAALVLEGAAIASEYARMLSRPGEGVRAAELGGGSAWSIEFFAGAAGIVLGILALLNVAPADLVAIAAITFGGALVLGSGSAARVSAVKAQMLYKDERTQQVASEMGSSSVATQALAGLAAIVLGILALAGFAPTTLVLIALLALGAVILLNGTILSGAMLSVFQH